MCGNGSSEVLSNDGARRRQRWPELYTTRNVQLGCGPFGPVSSYRGPLPLSRAHTHTHRELRNCCCCCCQLIWVFLNRVESITTAVAKPSGIGSLSLGFLSPPVSDLSPAACCSRDLATEVANGHCSIRRGSCVPSACVRTSLALWLFSLSFCVQEDRAPLKQK